jgi:hypothetical protein
MGIYGADSLTLIRHSRPRGGPLRSLRIEEIAWYFRRGVCDTPPAELVLDVGWMIVSSVDASTTREMTDSNQACALDLESESLRAVRVRGRDGKIYVVVANFSEDRCSVPLGARLDLIGGDRGGAEEVLLPAGEARVFVE